MRTQYWSHRVISDQQTDTVAIVYIHIYMQNIHIYVHITLQHDQLELVVQPLFAPLRH